MQTLHGLDALRGLEPGAVLSIGNFDGVHRGHQRLLELGRELKRAESKPVLAVATFEPHPLTVLRPERAPARLTPLPMKAAMLQAAGVDRLIVLPPAPEVLNLSAEQFWELIRDQARPSHLVEGPLFTFGKGRGGNIQRLREWTAAGGVALHVVEPVTVALLDLRVVAVSSSLVRWLLSNGRVREAAICLGRAYALEGEVVAGHGRGRQIGVPTANLRLGDLVQGSTAAAGVSQLVPMEGVYAGRCRVDGRTWPAAVSIGTMPTFGSNPPQIEAHLIGFEGDLYGTHLSVELLDWLREQRPFPSLDALKRQMAQDLAICDSRVHDSPGRAIASVA